MYSVRQIIVIINEGYKKIYNFTTINKNGDEIVRDRNQSFWIKDIGGMIVKDLNHFENQYNELTIKLENYLKNNFEEIKEQRNLSIHYDRVPTKVYDMLNQLNFEEIFKKLIPFFDILNQMFDFTHVILKGYNEKSEIKKQKTNASIKNIISILDNLKKIHGYENIEELEKHLKQFLI